MKRLLLTLLVTGIAGILYGQTTYYWVGGTAASTSISAGANWNTALNGTGSSRPSATGASDILVVDGTNVGGATPATGAVTILANGGITCAQLKFVNNCTVNLVRTSSGTTTVTISGEAGDDFVIEAGSTVNFTSTVGSIRMAMAVTCTGKVSGALSMITPLQARFDNTTGGTPNSFIFTSGSSFTTNITSASSSYAFGSSSQSSEKWVSFEAGSHLYYDGGYSPNGSGANFSAINMKPGSTWHHRANNPVSGFGNFFNRQSYGNISVENGATLTAFGPIYRVEMLTVNANSSFITHTSGQTVVLGNMQVDGTFSSDPAGTNELVLAGASQSVSGSGTINLASLIITDNAQVTLNRDLNAEKTVTVYGKVNFGTYHLGGNATFIANGAAPPLSATANAVAGSYFLTGNNGIATSSRGMGISGAGIAPNTSIVSYSATGDSIYLSAPLQASGTAMAVSILANGATLQNNNGNGYNPANGSVQVSGIQTFNDGINYIVDGAGSWPFGISTAASPTPFTARFIDINAPVTINRAFTVSHHLAVNARITLRPLDVVRLMPGAVINGSPGASNYIATISNASTGEQSFVQADDLSSSTVLPLGTAANYLPVTISPAATSTFTATVFEGITANGNVNGTALTASQKQRLVDAVWQLNRLSGSGTTGLQFEWTPGLEGSTFTTLPSADIGVIVNNGASWDAPIGSGDNAANTAQATVTATGSFAVGAVPPSQPFTFNPIPSKTYGDADFNAGASSLNTTQPIVYSSDNNAVATIVGGNVHITGAGTANITATQASDGFYSPASVTQALTVDKAALTIKADDLLKFQNQPNPPLTATYTGFVAGETPVVLLTPATLSTTATTSSPAGTYPISVSGATAANYTITFVNGILTVQPQTNQTITFNALPAKTYGNADFPANATSTNNTIPVTYNSSNPAVATVNASGVIHITGGGTTTITASQAGNAGYFPAPDVARTLTVNKAPLTVKVLDTTKIEGQVNPVFTLVYTGFVLGETVANLATPPTVNTTATTGSPAGYYTLTPEGAVTNNYLVTYTPGRLTIYPPNGTGENHIHAFMSNATTLTVRVYSTYPALGDISLFDLNGKPLLKKNIFMPQGFATATINVGQLPSGIYIVTARGSGVELKKTIPIIR